MYGPGKSVWQGHLGYKLHLRIMIPQRHPGLRQALWGRHAGAPLMKYPKVTVTEFDCGERGRLAPRGAIFIDLAQRNEHVYCLRAKSLLRQLYQLRFPSPGFLAANGTGRASDRLVPVLCGM